MSQQAEHEEIKKKILTTGIRVGTEVKTKFMIPYITQANPEGLYLFDLDITLSRIQTASRFIKKFDMKKVIVYSGRTYANTPIEKFCELTGARKMLGRFMPGTLTNPLLPYYSEPELMIVLRQNLIWLFLPITEEENLWPRFTGYWLMKFFKIRKQ